MGRGNGPKRGRPSVGPPGEDRPPYDMGLPPWGPPPPGGWGPPSPGGWGPPPPGGWDPRGPPTPGWGLQHPEDWIPPLPQDWAQAREHWRQEPGGWRGPPEDWGPPPGWVPGGPAGPWGPEPLPAGPLAGPHAVPPVGIPPPDPSFAPGWAQARERWRQEPGGWRGPPEDWGPPPGWVPGGPVGPWGPKPLPAGPPAVPPVGIPPPDPSFAPVPPVPPPVIGGPFGFPPFTQPPWTGQPIVEEPMLNPPPEQPEWIKALISAPPTDSAPSSQPPSQAAESDVSSEAKVKVDVNKDLCLLGKRTFDKPPPGRSTGIISFVGPSFGYIEREDLQKFTFRFDTFFGNPKAMTPGVRVHFTACKEKNSEIATDVKVAPGGTENVDMEIFEAVVSQPIVDPQPGERQYPGQVFVNLGPLRTNLSFERMDSSVTLLKDDQVLLNVLNDIVTKKRRATNIRPKIPSTFAHTKETRLKGIISSLSDTEGVIVCDEHSELPFEIKENFSEVDFSSEDVGEEVIFTLQELKTVKRAIRIQRAKEPLLLTLSSAKEAEGVEKEPRQESRLVLNFKEELLSNLKLDPELYEGIVRQPIIEPTDTTPGYPGQISANIGPAATNVTFDHRDCSFTLLKNDHVLINLLVDTVTNKRRAANIRPKIPFTFVYTKEVRVTGVITYLGPEEGILKSEEHGELPFDLCENFSDNEFTSSDVQMEVEFTVATVNAKKRAIRLRRMKSVEDPILLSQKRRRKEEEMRRQAEEQKEVERKKKEEVTAALAAAKDKWTPLGFTVRDPDSLDTLSKERFEGTVLRAISKKSHKEVKKEVKEEKEEKKEEETKEEEVKGKVEQIKEDEKQDGESLAPKVKEEKMEEEGEQEKKPVEEVLKKEVLKKVEPPANGTEAKVEMGRLVMTVDGKQKLLSFSYRDLLSTATMLDGDKVRFNIATNSETKEERATFVEILPDSFEESIEQRRHGIVIEFSSDSGLIKCTQNPQLYFHMSEVIEKKRLELNEKVEFSVVPHETAEGGHQAIRIKRFTESVFLPVKKLGAKGKMTIKLSKPSEDDQKVKPETDKLKAVVKTLRAQDSKSNRRDYSSSRRRYGRTRSRSRSPRRDQFGRILLDRRSPSVERRSSRHRVSRERSHRHSRSRSKSSSRGSSRSRSKEKAKKKRSRSSREREEVCKRKREPSPPRREGMVDDELARKKRELEELNEMIAYKKSLVDVDPRGMDPGQRTCIDYDHGRIAVPLTEYKPARSILKKQPEGPDYSCHPSYDEPYYSCCYNPYKERRYNDLSSSRSFADPRYLDHPYDDRPYENHRYDEPPYSLSGQRYTDRYDVYDESYDDRYCDSVYSERAYDQFDRSKQSDSTSQRGSSPPSDSSHLPSNSSYIPSNPSHLPSNSPSSSSHLTSSSSHLPSNPSPLPSNSPSSSSSSHLLLRPSPQMKCPSRSPSPKPKSSVSRSSPQAEKAPLDRFLDMLNKKSMVPSAAAAAAPSSVNDDLLPHERALQDGKGFCQIVGTVRESLGLPRDTTKRALSPKRSSSERVTDEAKTEPYDKIQNLLRTIGLKLSSSDMSKLASRVQDKLCVPKSTSTERDALSFPSENPQLSRTGLAESEQMQSSSSARSSSVELLGKQKAGLSQYEGFLDQQELEALKKAQKLHSLSKTMASASAPKPPSEPPPVHSHHPPPLVNWPLGITSLTQTSTSSSLATSAPSAVDQYQKEAAKSPGSPPGHPPGPPPGPPPRRPRQSPPGPPPGPPPRRSVGQPPFLPLSNHMALPFLAQSVLPSSPSAPSGPPQHPMTSSVSPSSSAPLPSCSSADSDSAISTTVARCLKVIETVKSLASQPPAKQAKSVQFSLPTEVSPSLSPAEMDNDVAGKQREKLDLYNQRILERREQQHQEMLARRRLRNTSQDGSLTPQGKPASSEPKNVWICGHSLVYWAESRAKSPEVGMQLGMDPSRVAIWWKGTQGMTWCQLLPQLHQLKVTWPNPDILIVHLGGNDLSTDSPTDLLLSVRKDLASMRSIFPRCILVWSNILPRRVWRHSADHHEMDLVRTTVNRRIQSIVSELGGTSLTHDNIRCSTTGGLYRADGVHLSPKGIDVFNLNLQDFLEKWVLDGTDTAAPSLG